MSQIRTFVVVDKLARWQNGLAPANKLTHILSFQNYNTYLRRLFLSKREDAEEDKVRKKMRNQRTCKFYRSIVMLAWDKLQFTELNLWGML